jgi:hypothetical protein
MSLESTSSPSELAGILRTLLRPAGLRELTRPLVEPGADPDVDVDALAAGSYAHPNGFDKLVLRGLQGGQKIVLHAWWPQRGEILEDGNYHDHRWHFATAVLTGTYRFVEYEEAPAGEPDGLLVHKHEYASPNGGSGYRLRPAGRRRLKPVKAERLTAGSIYLLSCDVVHHIQIENDAPTVTLFVQGPPVRQSTRVFSPHLQGQTSPLTVDRFSAAEYAERLRRALDAVG